MTVAIGGMIVAVAAVAATPCKTEEEMSCCAPFAPKHLITINR